MPIISIDDIYDKDINFIFGAGASFGVLPTLQLQLRADDEERQFTLEELATKFDRENDPRLIPLFMYYYAKCIRPAELLSLESAMATEPSATVIKNYRVFMKTVLEMVKHRKALDRRCNVFTTNYDGCFPLVADALIKEGNIDFVLNDGARGFTERTLQARNFGSYLCQAGVFGRYQSSIPQINLIHLHGSVYWSKLDAVIRVGYDLSSRQDLLNGDDIKLLAPFFEALDNSALRLADLPFPDFPEEQLENFWSKYERMPIVNPTKWKFHETVYEEHYYQMLRLLSYELEKPNAVLIAFGFSFSDEHIINLVRRSLSNPGLQVFVCCFNIADHDAMKERFKSHRNVNCLVLENGIMDFTAFNEHVLAWPAATSTTSSSSGAVAASAAPITAM